MEPPSSDRWWESDEKSFAITARSYLYYPRQSKRFGIQFAGGAVQDANGQSTCPDDCSVMGEIQAGHCGLITAHQIFIVLH